MRYKHHPNLQAGRWFTKGSEKVSQNRGEKIFSQICLQKIHLQQAVDGKVLLLGKNNPLQQSLIRKINIESENDGLEDDFPLHMGDVLVPC